MAVPFAMAGLQKRCLENGGEVALDCVAEGMLCPGACEQIHRWELQLLEVLRRDAASASCNETRSGNLWWQRS